MAPPAAPAAAPFFLPTVPGLTPRFTLPVATEQEAQVEPPGTNQSAAWSLGNRLTLSFVFQSKLLSWNLTSQRSEFSSALDAALHSASCESPSK